MNKIILTLAAVMTMSFSACAQKKGEKNSSIQCLELITGTAMKYLI